mgnify:CR=1 FL=1
MNDNYHNVNRFFFFGKSLINNIVDRLIEVGDEFCNSNSSELENSMRQLTIKYFESYHASKLEELRIFLENESWTQCPVRSKFNLTHLQVNCLKGEGISFSTSPIRVIRHHRKIFLHAHARPQKKINTHKIYYRLIFFL